MSCEATILYEQVAKSIHRIDLRIANIIDSKNLLPIVLGLFSFKGGTSLMLLLDTPHRLSTDIDIIAEPGTDMEEYVQKASTVYPFVGYEENKRKGANNIVKQHFRFFFQSVLLPGKEISILLDVLYEENHYANLTEREIHNGIVQTEGLPTMVTVPSIESIFGG